MITKCLFPAAGYGTRFLPATKAQPCPMWYEPEREFVFPMRYEPEAKGQVQNLL